MRVIILTYFWKLSINVSKIVLDLGEIEHSVQNKRRKKNKGEERGHQAVKINQELSLE